jgi:hypothetical protein
MLRDCRQPISRSSGSSASTPGQVNARRGRPSGPSTHRRIRICTGRSAARGAVRASLRLNRPRPGPLVVGDRRVAPVRIGARTGRQRLRVVERPGDLVVVLLLRTSVPSPRVGRPLRPALAVPMTVTFSRSGVRSVRRSTRYARRCGVEHGRVARRPRRPAPASPGLDRTDRVANVRPQRGARARRVAGSPGARPRQEASRATVAT